MDLQLNGKKAFISGLTQGIGLAIAKQLLNENVAVTINGRNSEKTERVRRELRTFSKHTCVSNCGGLL